MSALVVDNPAGTMVPNVIYTQGVALDTSTKYSWALAAREPKIWQGQSTNFLFDAAAKYRAFFLLSPLWVVILFVCIAYIGGPEARKVLEFMAPWSTAPFQH